jgi:hypothetical protein
LRNDDDAPFQIAECADERAMERQMNGASDPLHEVREGIHAAMALSLNKLLRLGYPRDFAKRRLLELARDAVNQLDE